MPMSRNLKKPRENKQKEEVYSTLRTRNKWIYKEILKKYEGSKSERDKEGKSGLIRDRGEKKNRKLESIYLSIYLSQSLSFWFVGWVLWNINHWSLFNAKFSFIQIISSISNFCLTWVHSLIVKNSSISSNSV